MSGHMRTFRRTYHTCVSNVLQPNRALLFMSTYPDIGDKRFGIRFQERDDPASVREIAQYYSPYLAAMYAVDVPAITRRLWHTFPTVFQLTQWSWMIYQLYMMELAHNVTLQYVGAQATVEGDSVTEAERFLFHNNSLANFVRGKWKDFDIVVRIRPDLYILGQVTLTSIDFPHQAEFSMSCGGKTFTDVFNETQLLRAPHHPRLEWFADPLSDHSAVGFTKQMTAFLRLYSSILAMPRRKCKSSESFTMAIPRSGCGGSTLSDRSYTSSGPLGGTSCCAMRRSSTTQPTRLPTHSDAAPSPR